MGLDRVCGSSAPSLTELKQATVTFQPCPERDFGDFALVNSEFLAFMIKVTAERMQPTFPRPFPSAQSIQHESYQLEFFE